MNILIAADGSTYTKRMLAYLAAHDEVFTPAHSYTVLTVSAPVPSRAASLLEKDALKGYHADEAERVFKPIRSFFKKQNVQAAFVFKTGHIAETIARVADGGRYDMLVMGSHGHNALGSLVMGSVSNKVLAQCKTPVLLIR